MLKKFHCAVIKFFNCSTLEHMQANQKAAIHHFMRTTETLQTETDMQTETDIVLHGMYLSVRSLNQLRCITRC